MRTILLAGPDLFEAWRAAARALASERVPPREVEWVIGGEASDLFAAPQPMPAPAAAFAVPRAFLTLAEAVADHDDPGRFALLYAMLVRLLARPEALDEASDPLARRLEGMAREVRRREIGRKHGQAALNDTDMARPKARLSEDEQAGLAAAEAAERRL